MPCLFEFKTLRFREVKIRRNNLCRLHDTHSPLTSPSRTHLSLNEQLHPYLPGVSRDSMHRGGWNTLSMKKVSLQCFQLHETLGPAQSQELLIFISARCNPSNRQVSVHPYEEAEYSFINLASSTNFFIIGFSFNILFSTDYSS